MKWLYSLVLPIYESKWEKGKITNKQFSDVSKKAGYTIGCKKCGLTWNSTKMHTTYYQIFSGISIICEKCYAELETPENRWNFYLNIMNENKPLHWMLGFIKEIKKSLFNPWWEEKLKHPILKMDNSGLISARIKSDQLELDLGI